AARTRIKSSPPLFQPPAPGTSLIRSNTRAKRWLCLEKLLFTTASRKSLLQTSRRLLLGKSSGVAVSVNSCIKNVNEITTRLGNDIIRSEERRVGKEWRSN